MTRKFTGDTLVIATHNKGKLEEIRAILPPGLKILSAADFNLDAPEETGKTFRENAALKAQYVAEKTGLPALADDSGLCVNALNGDPGVYTADWAEQPDGTRDFDAAMQKVHDLIGANPDRSAYFFCCLALVFPDGHTEFSEGRAEGEIVWPPRGKKGHGYDPFFQPNGYTATYAELDSQTKNAESHRARAFRAMIRDVFLSHIKERTC